MWMDVDANVIVPMNKYPITDDTDFKSIETGVVYNTTGIKVYWNFYTTAGATTSVEIHPTTGGVHDISEPIADMGIYAIEIPASGGDHANNDTEGFGWITGNATGMLPWSGPIVGFRAAAINNSLVDGATVDVNVTAIAANAIKNASFDADTNSTAYATNKLALALRVLMVELNLDHLAKVATAAADMTTEVVDDSILSRILANGNTSDYDPATDGLRATRAGVTALTASESILDKLAKRMYGKTVIDRGAGTIDVYDTAGTSVLYTLTMATEDDVDTITYSEPA